MGAYIRLFSYREYIAAGWPRKFPPEGTGRPRSTILGAPKHRRAARLAQSHGLEDADICPLEQGTLLLPPSPANAFPTPPNTRALLTVCASAQEERAHSSSEKKMTFFTHGFSLDIGAQAMALVGRGSGGPKPMLWARSEKQKLKSFFERQSAVRPVSRDAL